MVLYLILMVAIFVVAGVLFVYFSSKKQAITTDQILTARGSSPWWQVTLSSIAVLMGAWALFSPQETAMIAGVPGCFAFALGSVLGIFVFGFVGLRVDRHFFRVQCTVGHSAMDRDRGRADRRSDLHDLRRH